jgi:hypothetical protein
MAQRAEPRLIPAQCGPEAGTHKDQSPRAITDQERTDWEKKKLDKGTSRARN